MIELCTQCDEKPIDFGKYKLCFRCYAKFSKEDKLLILPKYTTHKKKISDECIKDMIDEGFNLSQIAKTCNMSRQGVHQRVDKEKYKTKMMYHKHYEIIFLHKIGFTPIEIDELTQNSKGAASRIMRMYNVKKPRTLKQIIFDKYDNGKTLKQIANGLNIHINTVYTHLYKYKNYKPLRIRDKNKHAFEVNFLRRLGFTNKEIQKYTGISYVHIGNITHPKFKLYHR